MENKGERTIKLAEPIQFGSETIEELVFRKPKAKDFRSMPVDPGVGDLLNLAGRLAGQPPSVIDDLSVEDMLAVLEIVEGFIPAGRETGRTASR